MIAPTRPVSDRCRSVSTRYPYWTSRTYSVLNFFRIRLPQYCAEPMPSSICLCGFASAPNQPITSMLWDTILRCSYSGLARLASLTAVTFAHASCIGLMTAKKESSIAGFLAFVVIRRNLRCASNAFLTNVAYMYISHNASFESRRHG